MTISAGGAAPMMEDEAAAIAVEVAPAIRRAIDPGRLDPTRIEPQVLVDVAFTPRPATPVPVRIAQLELPPNGAWRPPVTPCRDVLVLVREGELRAVGTGIAPPQAPSTIYGGDAVRFGPEGDGLLQNLSDQRARTIVAIVTGADGSSCADDAVSVAPDPLVGPIRMSSVRSTPVLSVANGAMQVRILLDADSAGARHGGLSVLDADADMVVPEHRHPESAEVLFVEQGGGVLTLEGRQVAVRAGAAIYVPPGALHSFRGDGGERFRAIQVYTPSGPEQRFRGGT